MNTKTIIGIVAILALVGIFIAIFIRSRRVTTTTSGETVKQPGLIDSLVNIFSSQGTSTGTSTGESVFCKIFPRLCDKGNGTVDVTCDCSNPGYTADGDVTPGCSQIGDEYIKQCS